MNPKRQLKAFPDPKLVSPENMERNYKDWLYSKEVEQMVAEFIRRNAGSKRGAFDFDSVIELNQKLETAGPSGQSGFFGFICELVWFADLSHLSGDDLFNMLSALCWNREADRIKEMDAKRDAKRGVSV